MVEYCRYFGGVLGSELEEAYVRPPTTFSKTTYEALTYAVKEKLNILSCRRPTLVSQERCLVEKLKSIGGRVALLLRECELVLGVSTSPARVVYVHILLWMPEHASKREYFSLF